MSTSIQRLSTVFTMCILFTGCSHDAAKDTTAPKSMPPLPVTILEVQSQKLPTRIEVVGQTEGSKEIEVRARVGGWLTKQVYQEGSLVKAGQPLFQIDRAPFEITATQARAALSETKARAAQAKREVIRLQDLLSKHAVSRKEVEDAQTNEQITQATLENTQAALRQAELNLSYTRVTAPATGLSGRAVRTEGNLIGTGPTDSLLTTIVQTQPIRARFSISENDIARLGVGQLTQQSLKGVELVLPDGTVYPKLGRLDFLASQIDPTLGTRSLRAEFDNPELQILPGQFVRIRLLTRQQRDTFLIPQVAVLQSEKGFSVFVTDKNNKVTPRPVQVGEWSGRDWAITEGLKPGDKVIVDNLIKLKPGMTVDPKPAQQPQQSPSVHKPDAKS